MIKRIAPTKAQVALVDEITAVLNIPFPESSADFTLDNYSRFIYENIGEYNFIMHGGNK